MTCIVAIVKEGKVLMGADSAETCGISLNLTGNDKIFFSGRDEECLIGIAGETRMANIIQHYFVAPPFPKHCNVDKYMFYIFREKLIRVISQCQNEGLICGGQHYDAKRNFEILIGIKRRIFSISSDFSVGYSQYNYNAIGCGKDLALGALFALEDNICSEDAMLKALKAAEAFNCGVRAPFIIKHLNSN